MKKRVIGFVLANILIYCIVAFAITATKAQDILDAMVVDSEWYFRYFDSGLGLSNAWPTINDVNANEQYISEATYRCNSISFQTEYTACYAMAMQDGEVIAAPNGDLDGKKLDNKIAKQAIKNIDKYKASLDQDGTHLSVSIFSYKKIASRQLEGIEGSVVTEYISYAGKPFAKVMDKNALLYINIALTMAILELVIYVTVKYKDKLVSNKRNIIICAVVVNLIIFLMPSLKIIIDEANIQIDYAENTEKHILERWNEMENEEDDNRILNGSYMPKLVYEYAALSWQDIYEASYAVAMENDEIYADGYNKMIFEFRTYSDDVEDIEVTQYYRIIDFDKLFTKEELADMTAFFKEAINNLYDYTGVFELYIAGKMDDAYIYPTHIAIGNYNYYEAYGRYFLSNEEWDKDAPYDMAVYVIDKEYSYVNKEDLVDVRSYWIGEGDIIDVREGTYTDKDNNKYYKKAISNIDEHKEELEENGSYKKKNIFTYEVIYSRQREVDGRGITEYVSYVRKPFSIGLKLYMHDKEYNKIIAWMILLNIVVLLVINKLIKRRNEYEDKARELFYNVTDKLTESVNNIKKINGDIVANEDESQRVVLDNEIKKLVSYIKDVLEWSKADAGALEIYPEEIEFSYMVEAVIKDVNKDSNIKLVTDMDMDAIIDGDLSRVAKAVAAFIRDVISKTDASENVVVQVKQNDGKVCFKVTNDETPNKFQYKENLELINKFDLLLGISYVKLHCGKYWYSNEDGKVTHTFEIPVKYEPENGKKKDGKVKDIYGVIAHEIKTPLNVIKLYNEALMDGGISGDKEKKYNAVIDTQLEIITNQIHEVASASHLKTGNLKGIKEKVDMAVLVNDMVARYNVLMEDKQLKVTVDGEKTVEAFVDYTGVKSIVSNYIINAVKYSDNGSEINITLEKDSKYVTIKIANDIPQNLRYNVDNSKQGVINRIERDGLGLIIARTYLDICKAKYGCNENDNTVEYWLKFRLK